MKLVKWLKLYSALEMEGSKKLGLKLRCLWECIILNNEKFVSHDIKVAPIGIIVYNIFYERVIQYKP